GCLPALGAPTGRGVRAAVGARAAADRPAFAPGALPPLSPARRVGHLADSRADAGARPHQPGRHPSGRLDRTSPGRPCGSAMSRCRSARMVRGDERCLRSACRRTRATRRTGDSPGPQPHPLVAVGPPGRPPDRGAPVAGHHGRPAGPVSSPETAFVLPAGGSIGAVQVGILRALAERGILPDVVVGCSVGALNAAYFALDPGVEQANRLAAVWQSLGRADVFGAGWARTVGRIVRRRDHIYDPEPLRCLIRRMCPLADLAEARIPVHVVTTDLDLGLARWWSRGPAHELLYASACLPGLFPPAVIDGRRHVDGGVLEPVPVQRAVDLDVTDVYLLGEVFGPSEDDPPKAGALDVLLRSFAVSRY